MYVGFHVDPCDDDKRVPISTGTTREDTAARAITRILSLGITSGGIAVVKQHQLDADEFAKIGKILDEWFASKGIQ